MKRINMFYLTRHKKVKDLAKQMETIEVEHQRSKLKKILDERKIKYKEMMSNRELRQPNFVHLKKSYGDFSFVESNASKEPFVSEKKRKRNFESDRVYSSSPNMKAGSSHNLLKNPEEVSDKVIINKKFMEYDRILDNQSGLRKMQAIVKRSQKIVYGFPRKKINQMKRTFFQKMAIDKYNFYTVNDYNSIKSTVLSHSKTDKQMKSQINAISKLRRFSSTTETQPKEGEYLNFQSSSLNRSRLKSKKSTEFQTYKSQINGRIRIKTQGSENIIPISLQKNLDSVQS